MFKPWVLPALLALLLLPLRIVAVEAVGSVLYDPMRPAVMPTDPPHERKGAEEATVVVEEEPLLLQAIKYHPQRPVAVINGKIVAIGEEVAGAKLQHLNGQQAILTRQGKPITLTLTSTSIKP